VASGEILDGDQPPGTVGGDSTARLIRQARLDKDIAAVVLRVDSPGGSVLASEHIYRELQALRSAGKPLVVSMGDLAASGGYYISAPADEIWASPATLTGSIGIFAIIPTVDKTLGKIGVNVDGVGTNALASQMRIDRPLGVEARALLQSEIERGYDVFLDRVSTGRKKTREQVDSIAQGRVWAGVDAKTTRPGRWPGLVRRRHQGGCTACEADRLRSGVHRARTVLGAGTAAADEDEGSKDARVG